MHKASCHDAIRDEAKMLNKLYSNIATNDSLTDLEKVDQSNEIQKAWDSNNIERKSKYVHEFFAARKEADPTDDDYLQIDYGG